ncbi:MAG: HU family DNA-binding protein, partial [Pseudonocardiaceae bacterium]
AAAVAGLVDVVVRAVNRGDKVTITGFGVFEKRARAARMARNPRTGQSVKVKKTNVPAFRPGTLFREVVSGARKLPRLGASTNGAAAARPAASATSHLTTSKAPTASPTVTRTETKAATKAAKAAAKAAKAAKKEAKNTPKDPTKVTARKAVKKSATKK